MDLRSRLVDALAVGVGFAVVMKSRVRSLVEEVRHERLGVEKQEVRNNG